MLPFLNITLPALVSSVGYLGLFCIIFAESGVFVGFFLPGDSLLFTAGILASQGFFNVWILLFIFAAGAVLGDSVGYWIGAKMGPSIFSREDSFLFHKKHVIRTQEFFDKYGPRAVVLARFVPVVRTFTPILAGVGSMSYRRFLAYNIVGGILWSCGFTLLGYFLGNAFPGTEKYISVLALGVVILSLGPIALEVWRTRRKNSSH